MTKVKGDHIMTAVDTLRRLWKAKMRPSLLAAAVGLAWFAVPGTTSTMTISAPPAAVDSFPTFDFMVLLESTSETSANVSAGDVNGDGYLDLVLAKGRHWPLVDRVLLGDGKGAFRTPYDLGTASDRSYSGRLADLDRDGDLDVVISNDTPDPKLVYLNDGKGHFRIGSTFGKAEWPTRNATVADVDGDGLPDIVVANRGDSESVNYICLNRGAGRFDDRCTPFSSEPATTITAADFDRDGLIDLAVPYRDNGQSRIYLAGRHATYSREKVIYFGPANASIRMTEAADLDGDGQLDLIAIDDKSGTAIYLGRADHSFGSAVPLTSRTPTPYALATADINGDGKVDIIIGNVEARSVIYYNTGDGRSFEGRPFGDNKGTVYGFAIADLNRDGILDIAAARSEAPNVLYFGQRQATSQEAERSATAEDIRIIDRADQILSDASKWDRADDRICKETDTTWSLFCAIEKATTEVLGSYNHDDRMGQAVTREIRRVIEELNPGRQFEHRLMNYNNLPTTRFEDIKKVLRMTRERLAAQIKKP